MFVVFDGVIGTMTMPTKSLERIDIGAEPTAASAPFD
jgi:hypothetical protein